MELRSRSKDDFRSPDTDRYENVRCLVVLPDVITNVQMGVIIYVNFLIIPIPSIEARKITPRLVYIWVMHFQLRLTEIQRI